MTNVLTAQPKRLSFLLFLMLIYLAWTIRATLLHSTLVSLFPIGMGHILFSNLVKVLFWLLPALLYLTKIDKQNPLMVIRINTQVNWNNLWKAFLVSLIFLIASFAIEYFSSGRTLMPLMYATPYSVMKEFAVVFLSPFVEEIFFRGVIFSKFLENQRFLVANILQSLLFTAIHWPHWIWIQGLTPGLIVMSLSILALGLLLGWITFRTNSIWPAISIHILNNFLVAFLG